MINRQDEILYYLYRFRFLTRNQLQKLLHHKSFNRIIIWLNELTENKYIRRYYNPKTVTIPAIYSLGTKGRIYLKNNSKFKDIKDKQLDRVWKEHKLSIQFRKHCLFLADFYISLLELTQQHNSKLHFRTKTDLSGVKNLMNPFPDAYFTIEEKDDIIKRYFLDVFDSFPEKVELRKRVDRYIRYYEDNLWQEKTNTPFPNVILVAPDDRSKNYLQRYIMKILDESEPIFYLSTWGKINENGLNKGILEKVGI